MVRFVALNKKGANILLLFILEVFIKHCYTKKDIFCSQGEEMRKFFRTLFALIIIAFLMGTAVFFVGWTQFRLKNDTFGILISKTGGISQKPVKSGIFVWNWEFLIPTNARLECFPLNDISISKNYTGKLPSSDLYAKTINSENPFTYYMNFTAKVHVPPERILSLLNDGKISNAKDLNTYIDSAVEELCTEAVVSLISKKIKQQDFMPSPKDLQEILDSSVATKRFSDLVFTDFTLNSYELPDYKLYITARDYYLKALYKLVESELTRVDLSPAGIISNIKEINSNFEKPVPTGTLNQKEADE